MSYFTADPSLPENQDQKHIISLNHCYDDHAPVKDKRRRSRREQKQKRQERRNQYRY